MASTAFQQTCPQCRFRPRQWVNDCPQCGGVIESPQRVRTMGWVAVVLGVLLSVGMAALMVVVGGLFRGPGFTGDASMVAFVYGVLGLILLLGIASAATGTWQVRRGTRNPRMAAAVLMLGLAYVVALAVYSLRTL